MEIWRHLILFFFSGGGREPNGEGAMVRKSDQKCDGNPFKSAKKAMETGQFIAFIAGKFSSVWSE
jgi:hypothetical protein